MNIQILNNSNVVDKAKVSGRANYGIYCFYTSATLVTKDKDNDYEMEEHHFPLVVDQVARATGFASLAELKKATSPFKRSDELNDRLSKLFDVSLNLKAFDEPIKGRSRTKEYEIPFPFIVDLKLLDEQKPSIYVTSFDLLSSERHRTFSVGAGFNVALNGGLCAREGYEELCNILARNKLLYSGSLLKTACKLLLKQGLEIPKEDKILVVHTMWGEILRRVERVIDVRVAAELYNDQQYEGWFARPYGYESGVMVETNENDFKRVLAEGERQLHLPGLIGNGNWWPTPLPPSELS